MVDPEIIRRIRELTRMQWGSKRIAAELGLARNTVRRYRHLQREAEPDKSRPGGRRLDEAAQQQAVQMLGAEAAGNAVVIHRLLVGQGHQVSLRTVQRNVAGERAAVRRKQLATVRFETSPGAQMQIDFGEKRVRIGEQTVRVFLFVAVLGFSRRIYVRAFLSQRHDDWREGIAGAFLHFGGVTQSLLIDNPKAMVIHHGGVDQVTLHPAFAAFCKDWGVEVRACAPYRARTKGKTESGVKYVKHNALAGLSFTSFGALVAHLNGWMEMADARSHGTTGEAPALRFEVREKASLRPLPSSRLSVRQRRLHRKVSNDCLVDIDSIRYSIPHRFVGCRVEVAVCDNDVCVYAGSELIARHRRGSDPHSRIIDPSHYDGILRRPGRAEDSTLTRPVKETDKSSEKTVHLLDSYVSVVEEKS